MHEINPLFVVLLTLLAVVLVWLMFALANSGGSLGRYSQARGVARRWLRDKDFALKVDALNQPPKPPEPPRPNPEPLRLLTLLQRDGRLLDFLLEDVASATDKDLGAGVREIHRQCQKALKEHLVLEPVLPQN
jgi:hypothetical protein